MSVYRTRKTRQLRLGNYPLCVWKGRYALREHPIPTVNY